MKGYSGHLHILGEKLSIFNFGDKVHLTIHLIGSNLQLPLVFLRGKMTYSIQALTQYAFQFFFFLVMVFEQFTTIQ